MPPVSYTEAAPLDDAELCGARRGWALAGVFLCFGPGAAAPGAGGPPPPKTPAWVPEGSLAKNYRAGFPGL